MTFALTDWFFLMFFIGIIWGIIEAWNEKAGFALFILVVLVGIVSTLMQSATAAQTGPDVAHLVVSGLGYFIGLTGGKAVYRSTFETSDATLEASR